MKKNIFKLKTKKILFIKIIFITIIHNEKSMKHQTEELTKDQKLDKVFWFKVIISIIFGIIFGIFKFTGFITLIG